MPGGDRTGPAGAGPMTGRGMGPCAGHMQIGFGCGRVFTRRFRRGFGFRATPAPETDIAGIKTQISRIQQQLEALGEP